MTMSTIVQTLSGTSCPLTSSLLLSVTFPTGIDIIIIIIMLLYPVCYYQLLLFYLLVFIGFCKNKREV